MTDAFHTVLLAVSHRGGEKGLFRDHAIPDCPRIESPWPGLGHLPVPEPSLWPGTGNSLVGQAREAHLLPMTKTREGRGVTFQRNVGAVTKTRKGIPDKQAYWTIAVRGKLALHTSRVPGIGQDPTYISDCSESSRESTHPVLERRTL